MGFVNWLRGLVFAWLRFLLACLIVSAPISLLMIAGDYFDPQFTAGEHVGRAASMVFIGGLILALGSPLVLAYRVIARKERPYLRWGYWLVVIYGPLLWYIQTRDIGQAVGVSLVYQPAAAAVFAVYILIWKAGDRIYARMRSAA